MKEIEAELINESTAVVIRERSSVLLMPVMDLNTAKSRLQEFQEFCAHYLQESQDGGNDGGDYGVIPGTKKKTLLKSGADKLAEIYGLYDEYVVMSNVEDWTRGLFDYTLKCVLKSRRDDSMVGAGVGSCSSFESKYRWRDEQRKCPTCGSTAIIKGKAEFGGGWLCWTKKGGCGGKFKDGDKSIEGQVIGRCENPDIIDVKNTVLKMAKKRAKIDAVIGVTRSSGIFTHDMDDIPMPAPAKPPVERTEADIPLPPRSAGGNHATATTQEGAVKPAETEARFPVKARVVTDAAAPSQASVAQTPGRANASLSTDEANRLADAMAKQAKVTMKPKKAEKEPAPLSPAQKFHVRFREELQERYRVFSDQILADWLVANHPYTEGHAGNLPQDEIPAIWKDAAKFARSYDGA